MKKFLFSIFAVAMAMTASAQTVTAEVQQDGSVNVNYVPGETALSAFSLYMKTEGGATISGTYNDDDAWASVTTGSGKTKTKVFSVDPAWSKTSNKEGYGVMNVKSNPITALPEGLMTNVCFEEEKSATGTLTILPVFSTLDSKSVTLDPITVELGTASGIQSVNATSVLNGKFIENGSVVIVKNGKKFNAAGAQMK